MEENKQQSQTKTTTTSIWKSKLLAIKNMVIENVVGGAGNALGGSGTERRKYSKEN